VLVLAAAFSSVIRFVVVGASTVSRW